jgi:hypothetical protein
MMPPHSTAADQSQPVSSRRSLLRILTLFALLAAASAIAVAAGMPMLADPGRAPRLEGDVAGAVSTSSPSATPAASSTQRLPATPGPATPVPSRPIASPSAAVPTPSPSARPAGPFAMNLYRKGDFVHQVTKEQCASAAMQIMLNIVRDRQDRTAATQSRLAVLARQLSNAPDHGTEPLGWARGLTRLGAGRYVVAIEPTRARAIRRAVIAIRQTGRPVGLLVWWGAHSWVMHGFAASADPAATARFTIRAVYLSDPWYPSVSSIWGASRPPNARVDPKLLPEDYIPWQRPTRRYPGMDGKFVLVVPVLAPGESPAP